MSRGRRTLIADENGTIVILVAFLMTLLLGFAAIVIDLGRTRHARQQLQDAVDSASLSASAYLPVHDASTASSIKALTANITVGSAPGLSSSAVATTFWCVLSSPPNTPGGSAPDLGGACGPKIAGAWNSGSGWTLKSGTMSHTCDPYSGDTCNAVKVRSSEPVKYLFAPAIGVTSGNTGSVQSIACQGMCKPITSPLDIALVLDRTASMSPADIANVRTAALSLLKVYDPTQQHIALFMLPHGRTDLSPPKPCQTDKKETYPDTTWSHWQSVPFSSGYRQSDGTLVQSDPLVATINCYAETNTGSGTNLGDPLAAASTYLQTFGRADVSKIVIFLSDGEANQPSGSQPCTYAAGKAATAKSSGITVYTIGYGIEDARCASGDGSYSNAYATKLFAAMASSSTDNQPGGCAATENTDGDSYFCNARDADLQATFRLIAVATIKHGRLIDVE
jgi:hypothetical protein